MEIQYKITKLDETKYQFNFDFDYNSIDVNKCVFLFSHSLQSKEEENEITVEIIVKIAAPESEIILALQGVRASFYVNPFTAVVPEKNEEGLKVDFPELMDTFANITVGALRGMLAKNLNGTPLKNCIVPLISMEYLHKMLVGKR